ncbi:MAG: class I SAM-dependent methyltransferase [Promethearchaeota archaeon]
MKFQKILNQLKLSGIARGVWIDAGCGSGTYTFPLATLADRVIAIDNNHYNTKLLQSKLPPKTNIEVFKKDFNQDLLFNELVDGILFGFSLHYGPYLNRALQNAFNHLKLGGNIIVFDYTREEPLPWVPYPIPKYKLIRSLENIGFKDIETILQDARFYIVRGVKSEKNT